MASDRKPNSYQQQKTYNTGVGSKYNVPGKGTSTGRGGGASKPKKMHSNKDPKGGGGGNSPSY